MKLSFKNYTKLTGNTGIGYSHSSITIKLNGEKIGIIHAPNWTTEDKKWRLKFTVISDDTSDPYYTPNCAWKWITLKVKFDDGDEAKEFVKKNIDQILKVHRIVPV